MPRPALALLAAAMACNDGGLTAYNVAPKARITSPVVGESVPQGRPVTIRGAASDDNDRNEVLTARWFVDDQEVCPGEAVDRDGSTNCTIVAPTGAFEVELEVRDPRGEVGVARRRFGVLPDQAPTAQITRPLEGQGAYADALLTVQALISDEEDDPTELTVWWETTSAGVLDVATAVNSNGEVETFFPLEVGEHGIYLHVRDTVGNIASDTVRVRVSSTNAPPLCAIRSPGGAGPGSEAVEEPLVAEVSDPNEWPVFLDVSWSSDLDGALGGAAADEDGLSTHAAPLSRGTHALTLTVTDSEGLSCTDMVVWRVEAPPVIAIDTPSDGAEVGELSEVRFSATVSDAEDPSDQLHVAWFSARSGMMEEGLADAAGQAGFSVFGLAPGTDTVTATVTDASGLSSSESVTVLVNGAPTAPVVVLEPASPRTADRLVATLVSDATDPEGDPLTYVHRWVVDGAPSSASTSDALPAAATRRDEVWEVFVTAHDGTAEGASGTASVTIANTPPTASAAGITPNPAVTGDTLACSIVGYADADGDPDASTFQWTIGGAVVGAGPSLSGGFTDGDTVTCAAPAHDGTDAGTVVSDSVTIGNARPSIVSAVLTPSTVRTDDTVSVGVVTSDPEGDAVTLAYAWSVSGVSASATGASLDGSVAFDRGDLVEVTVTPSDAGGGGTPASVSATVANTAPGAPTVSIAPAGPVEGESLVCQVDTASADADGDAISYTMGWSVDGVAYPRSADLGPATSVWTDDTTEGADNSEGEVWTCVATPDDGTDAGATGSASETIGPAQTRVFVTSDTWAGDHGGVSGADQHCQDAADAVGLGGVWVAWLSSTSRSAKDQVGPGPYVL
ncbi:MAG: Ig-like domain-containing protein, partial [Myxococcota bacterium]|nr:Ig-like domain-containing protein [Myxococcota bacterium]